MLTKSGKDQKERAQVSTPKPFISHGRDDWIRTSGLCVPNAALYQAEPRPVNRGDPVL
jgi:hypothetical protein